MSASATVPSAVSDPEEEGAGTRALLARIGAYLDSLVVPSAAVLVSVALFGLFVSLAGANPIEVYETMYRGAFGTWFSFQNSLQRAAPLMLTGLCTALPARLGLTVIGGEGALYVGGVAAGAAGSYFTGSSPYVVLTIMAVTSMAFGGLWIGGAGALRAKRGVNETISSLLLSYIGIAVCNHLIEGPLRDPQSLNKPSTLHIGEQNMLGPVPGLDVHYGLVYGIVACLVCWLLMDHSTFGFAARIVGGNPRAARLSGLAVPRLLITVCAIAGAAAGLAGMIEVAAVHGKANASLAAGYGYTGILVAFLARHSPLGIIPVSLILGGISASGGLLQRTFGLPDATVSVLQGVLFVVVLASETYRGKFSWFSRLLTPVRKGAMA
ncbi:MAG: ABC transporter permease [Myxococcales bacterium]|nr:MAG: ABC transporter permease [Myxococcales bacterium]